VCVLNSSINVTILIKLKIAALSLHKKKLKNEKLKIKQAL
jgi:hypothetical protein